MMDEKLALAYRDFYMRCIYSKESFQRIYDDFIASGLARPNAHTVRNRELLMIFTGTAFGQISPGNAKTAKWCRENLWNVPRCPFRVCHFDDRYWSGDPDLPILPAQRCSNPICRDPDIVEGQCRSCGRVQQPD